MKAKSYIILCCVVLLSIFGTSVWLRSKENFDTVPALEEVDEDKYIIHQTEVVPREDIRSFVIDNDKIYILYDKAALVNVYGTDGAFQYGIQISTIKSGHAQIAVLDEELYIVSHRSILFVFHDTQLVATFDGGSDQYRSTITLLFKEKNINDNSYEYEISASGSNIVRCETNKPVLDLPERSRLSDDLLVVGLFLLGLSTHFYSKLFSKKTD